MARGSRLIAGPRSPRKLGLASGPEYARDAYASVLGNVRASEETGEFEYAQVRLEKLNHPLCLCASVVNSLLLPLLDRLAVSRFERFDLAGLSKF